MKRRDLLKYLRDEGCAEIREGSRHSFWCNLASGGKSAIPRHSEVSNILVKKICKDLGIADPTVK